MIRIRSKEDFFIGGTSPWLGQSRRRNRKQYIGTWQEQNLLQPRFLKENGGPQLNPCIINDIEKLKVKEARPEKSKPENGPLIDEADAFGASPLAQYQVPGQPADERRNEKVKTILPLQGVSKQMRNKNEESLEGFLTLSSKQEGRNTIDKACYEDMSLVIYGEQDVGVKEIDPLQLSESLTESSRQNIGKREGSRNSQARAAEVAGVTFEDHARADFQPKRTKVNDGQDNYTPPAATSKLEKKTQRPQRKSMHRNQTKRTTYSPSMVNGTGQSGVVEGGDNGIEWAIALSNNLNLTYTHGTLPAAANEASSPVNIPSKPHSIMPRRKPKELLSSRQPADDKATHQPATTVPDILPPSLSVSGTPENSQQQQERHLHSPERPTTISEITDEEEAKEEKVFVPDRAAVQSLSRLFFTPRPERLLTREEMSRFLDPDLLPRFNPALRRPTKKVELRL
ncbi:hypothetical protein TWF788_011415 [Orbilia oligospora]|uniref:Uncharacterized protein n=1 Tax=Orbilia oligospora TaxID=2813651 RepID=A0A7C8KHM5_ORBOL|nr:hypothetical protein TWF788_011415 [Orbilia oligospora]